MDDAAIATNQASSAPQYSGMKDTANSAKEGRLIVDAGRAKKRKVLKKAIQATKK